MVVRFSPDPDPMAVVLQEVAQSGLYSRGHVMVAFASVAGVTRFYNALGVELCASTDIIVGMSWENTTPETIQSLHTICSRVFVAHTTQTFHPKMYLFDDGTTEGLPANARVIIGSSNLEDTGLQYNFEINVDHELNPATNEAHAITWNSAIDAWNQMRDDGLRTHQIGASPDSLAGDIQYWIDEGELRPWSVDTDEEDVDDEADTDEGEEEAEGEQDSETGASTSSATYLPPAATVQNSMSLPDLGDSLDSEDDDGSEPELESEPAPETEEVGAQPEPAPEPEQVVADTIGNLPQYYVRQLSVRERQKLTPGLVPGGHDFSITVGARNLFPQFWGWDVEFDDDGHFSRRYVTIAFNPGTGVVTNIGGNDENTSVWERHAGPTHGVEFKLTYPTLNDDSGVVLPTDEQLQNCLAVFSISEQEGVDFDWRIVLQTDADYQEFLGYCDNNTPHAQWGYSPVEANPDDAAE